MGDYFQLLNQAMGVFLSSMRGVEPQLLVNVKSTTPTQTSLAQEPINKYKLQSPFVVQSASCRSNDEKKQWHDSKFSHRYIFVFKIKGFPAEYLVQSHSWRIHKYSVVLGHIQKKKNSHSLSWLNVQKQSPFMNFTNYCLIVVLASFCMHITNPLLISLAFEQTELMQTISPGQRPWA